MRYLQHRGLLDPGSGAVQRRVWGFFGDGEMDEPESIAALSLAAREQLDNCTFVINCNLQRLDGPVRGNGRIVDELESLFAGAGWHVVKCLWSSDWDVLFARDHGHALMRAFAHTVDGQFQTLSAKDGAFNREVFFGQNAELKALVADLRDEDIDRLRRGGHDAVKIHAAFAAAVAHAGQPTVMLAKTMKGYAMGDAAQGRMTTHQAKKLDSAGLLAFRDRFALPMSDADTQALAFYKPADDSAEMRYLQSRRRALGGALPARRSDCAVLPVPPLESTAAFALHADGKEMSTTMAFVRMLGNLLKDPALGPRIVPIVADEARTFGMANLFRQVGIYAPFGQLYQPEDSGSILSYREDVERPDPRRRHHRGRRDVLVDGGRDGVLDARPGDVAVLHLLLDVRLPARRRPDLGRRRPARARLPDRRDRRPDDPRRRRPAAPRRHQSPDRGDDAELQGLRPGVRRRARRHPRPRHARDARGADGRLLLRDGDERERRPAVVARRSARRRAARHVSLSHRPPSRAPRRVQLLAAGAMLGEAIKAAEQLEAGHDVGADVWSVTSFSELARDGVAAESAWRRGATDSVRCHVFEQLAPTRGPIVMASDYVRAVPEQIRAFLPPGRRCVTLGTDGFGRSDTRAALRRHFEVDAAAIGQAALRALG